MKRILCYIMIAVVAATTLAGCGCSNTKKPHPNVIISSPEPAPDFCGEWTANVTAEGEEYVLMLEINENTDARYELELADGKKVLDVQGNWAWDEGMIRLDLNNTADGSVWRADFDFTYDGERFILTNTRGKLLVEGLQTVAFKRP